MLKISTISFRGTKKTQAANDNNVMFVAPGYQELGEVALPLGNKSLTINPSLPSDSLGEADLARFRNVQREWAESVAKKFGIPLDNVLVRLPEIRLGDPKQMITMDSYTYGQFKPVENVIEIIPMREIANLHGGDEAKVVHESLHAFFYNLRRAWAKQFTTDDLYVEATNIVATKMLKGEHGLIVKRIYSKKIGGQSCFDRDVMYAPSLSRDERVALVKTLYSLRQEHLAPDATKLTEAGEAFVKETLIPQLTSYSKHVNGAGEDKVFKNITDYMMALFTRRNLLARSLGDPRRIDLGKNLQTPLTESEQKLVEITLDRLLAGEEEGCISQLDSSGLHTLYESSGKSYFMSYEEIAARCEENLYRRDKVQKKIADAIGKGLTPGANLFEELRVVENNLTLVNLARLLGKVEEKIIGADKDPEKMHEINGVRDKITQYMEGSKKVRFTEMCCLIDDLNGLDFPEKLLAETPENSALRTQYYTILERIKAIAAECDLMSIPKQFFNSEADFNRVMNRVDECVQRCMRSFKW